MMLGEAMSILARSTMLPSSCWPSRISLNRARFSAGVRLLNGLSMPGLPKSPRARRICSLVCSSTYAWPASMRYSAARYMKPK
ncbi:hypothetical protein D9M68_973250 [compost metagenome]